MVCLVFVLGCRIGFESGRGFSLTSPNLVFPKRNRIFAFQQFSYNMQESYGTLCKIINEIHGLANRTIGQEGNRPLERKFDRIKRHFEELNIYIHDPIGEDYALTRLDCEASISGDATENLKIIEVIKPVVYLKVEGTNEILQRGLVIVEGQ